MPAFTVAPNYGVVGFQQGLGAVDALREDYNKRLELYGKLRVSANSLQEGPARDHAIIESRNVMPRAAFGLSKDGNVTMSGTPFKKAYYDPNVKDYMKQHRVPTANDRKLMVATQLQGNQMEQAFGAANKSAFGPMKGAFGMASYAAPIAKQANVNEFYNKNYGDSWLQKTLGIGDGPLEAPDYTRARVQGDNPNNPYALQQHFQGNPNPTGTVPVQQQAPPGQAVPTQQQAPMTQIQTPQQLNAIRAMLQPSYAPWRAAQTPIPYAPTGGTL